MDKNDVWNNQQDEKSFDVIVVGGGQAGLAAGYFLSKSKLRFIILDGNSSCGESWRKRWDSLRLFTPSQIDNLPGMPISFPVNYLPTKDEVADYLERYANQFNLPVKHQQQVTSLRQSTSGFEIITNNSTYYAKNVIICSGVYTLPSIPAFAGKLNSSIFQIHSSQYTNPSKVPTGSILVVGAGNSGADIAVELVEANNKVWLSGRDVGTVPNNSPIGKAFNGKLVWWIMTHIMTMDTPIGRKMIAKSGHHGTPLGHHNRQEIQAAGVVFLPRVVAVREGKPELENGQIMDVDAVIWATGYKPDYDWIKLPIFDQEGYPLHTRGMVEKAPGLFFLGLPFLSGISSSLLGGIGKDAERIVERIVNKFVG